jgi:hypothetical protein
VTSVVRAGRHATFRHDGGVTTPISEQLRLRCIEPVAQEGERFGALAHEMSPERLDIQVPWTPAWHMSPAAGKTAQLRGAAAEHLLHLWGRPVQVHVSGNPAAEAMLRGR